MLDLSQSGEVDISAAADELVKATAHFLPELFTAPVFRTELEEENTA